MHRAGALGAGSHTHLGLERAEQLTDERVHVAQGEHLALDHDAVEVVVLDDGDLLDALDRETGVVLLELG